MVPERFQDYLFNERDYLPETYEVADKEREELIRQLAAMITDDLGMAGKPEKIANYEPDFWLLDKLSEDESKFIEGKKDLLGTLNDCLKKTDGDPELKTLRDCIQGVNEKLEVVVNYRFWTRSSVNNDYQKIQRFYQDSRYLLSTIRRAIESSEPEHQDKSLAAITGLEPVEKEDILVDYRRGLKYIIDYVENWH